MNLIEKVTRITENVTRERKGRLAMLQNFYRQYGTAAISSAVMLLPMWVFGFVTGGAVVTIINNRPPRVIILPAETSKAVVPPETPGGVSDGASRL